MVDRLSLLTVVVGSNPAGCGSENVPFFSVLSEGSRRESRVKTIDRRRENFAKAIDVCIWEIRKRKSGHSVGKGSRPPRREIVESRERRSSGRLPFSTDVTMLCLLQSGHLRLCKGCVQYRRRCRSLGSSDIRPPKSSSIVASRSNILPTRTSPRLLTFGWSLLEWQCLSQQDAAS